MGVVKRGILEPKRSIAGSQQSSRAPLHLAVRCDHADARGVVACMMLQHAPRGPPSMLGVYHGHFEVNVYEVKRLPHGSLRLRSRDVPSGALCAFDAALRVVRASQERKELYVIRRQSSHTITYCEIESPDSGSKAAYRLAARTLTCRGIWEIYLLDFDEQHVDCRRASLLARWRAANTLVGGNSGVSALRDALGSPEAAAASSSSFRVSHCSHDADL